MADKIKDKRLQIGKENRNNSIRDYFEKRFNAGLRYEVVEEEIILKWGLSASTITKIIKGYAGYEKKEI